jgi:hypothetical protein
MEKTDICSHSELMLQIMRLKAEKLEGEKELSYKFKELVYTFNPVSLVKKSIHDLADDTDVKYDLAKIGLNVGANFLIDQLLGKNRSVKGFLSSLVVEKISSSYINNNLSSIIAGIGKLFTKKKIIEI